MQQRRVLALGIALSVVFASVLTADAKPGSQEGASRLPKLPIEEPLSPSITPLAPMEGHPPLSGGATGAVAPFVGSFEAAVRRTQEAGAPEGIRSHVQGEFQQSQPLDPSRESPTPPGDRDAASAPPTTGDDLLPQAPGDQVVQFNALANTGWIPPDTIMATGPSHVVEAVNSGFAVYSKTGTLNQGYTTFTSFFGPALPAGWQGTLFDPRVLYSATSSKFVMLILGRDSINQKSYHFIAVSQATDPTGAWWLWRFSVDSANAADSDAWMDYCGLGADDWGIYVTCNLFRWTGGFKYAQLWSLSPGMLNGGSGYGWVSWDLRWNNSSQAFSLQPALPHSTAADQATFFVNTFSSSGNSVLLWKLTGDRTSSPTLTRATIGIASYNAIGENVDQPGSSTDIDGGDARIMNAVYASRRVYTVLTTDVNNDGRMSGWLVLSLDVDANSLAWSRLVYTTTSATSGGFYYFYPAITIEGGGVSPNVAIFGSWTDTETAVTASTTYASGLFKIYTDPPANIDGPFVSFVSGLATYVALDSSGRNRWGDYSGAAYDWSTGNAWGAVEYAGTSNTWRTMIRGMTIADGGCSADGFEPDGSSGLASSISSGVLQTHNICPAGDEDWVSFTLGATSAVFIESSGPAGDTRMWLFDQNISQIDFDDDSGSGLFSFIDRTCSADPLPPGTYYVKLDEFGGDEEIATYNLAYDLVETCSGCVQDLVLQNTTITGTQSYVAETSVTLGPGLTINGTAVSVVAGQIIVLRSDTTIGGSFSAGIDPTICP